MGREKFFAVKVDQLKINEPHGCSLADDHGDVVLVRVADREVVAFPDRCSHADVPLSSGSCANGEITCPAHGARFSLSTGAAMCAPAIAAIQKLSVEIRNDEVWVEEP